MYLFTHSHPCPPTVSEEEEGAWAEQQWSLEVAAGKGRLLHLTNHGPES